MNKREDARSAAKSRATSNEFVASMHPMASTAEPIEHQRPPNTAAGRASSASSDDVFDGLIGDYGELVYRIAYSLVREATMAEDVTQETMLKVWQGLPGFRSDAPIKHWIVRIAHNTAISALRRRREEAHDPQEWTMARRPATTDVVRSVEDVLVREAFDSALGRLDPISRAIVVLREVDGMSYEDISTAMDVALPTVKTRLFRARRVLATELAGWNE